MSILNGLTRWGWLGVSARFKGGPIGRLAFPGGGGGVDGCYLRQHPSTLRARVYEGDFMNAGRVEEESQSDNQGITVIDGEESTG
jgi:hypothetical protein